MSDSEFGTEFNLLKLLLACFHSIDSDECWKFASK